MDDYISVLLAQLRNEHTASASSALQVHKALQALEATFSPEQHQLFMAYEDAANHAGFLSENAYARSAFLLAREIFR